ncbi:GGDEF domain-containing protein [Eubacterium sp. 1001713B170207_170306_E7]|uniref:GGDEF domain-containing protein n=1 Tax=Eubacterium sp. 1001713B170207_170306_E7 TaxID=2787097 RepID=UPI00189B31A9|nr:GGDEF domain-containing protein [Eubacterium sp. 1001713B170207_170306_E7]
MLDPLVLSLLIITILLYALIALNDLGVLGSLPPGAPAVGIRSVCYLACGAFLYIGMAIFGLPLPLFGALLYGLKFIRISRFPGSGRLNWLFVNMDFLVHFSVCLVLLGLFALAAGVNVPAVLHSPALRAASLDLLLLLSLATEWLVFRRPDYYGFYQQDDPSEETRLFTAFTFLAVAFVMIDSIACRYELPVLTIPLFLIGSSLLLLLMLGFFLTQLGTIRRQGYLEAAYARLESSRLRQETRTQTLRDTAYHDPLTGAYTRLYTMDYLELLLRQDEPFALVYLDLDHLKQINDACGHLAGDQYLKDFAALFQAELRESDLLGRIGGDEFLSLWPDCTGADAQKRVQSIRGRIEAGHRGRFGVSFSFGVSEARSGGNQSARELIRAADQAMYADKAARHRQREDDHE